MKRQNWEQVLEEYRGSGMSQADFCRERKIPLSSFSIQIRKFRERSSFVKLDTSDRVELELSSGVIVKVKESQLAAVMKALQL